MLCLLLVLNSRILGLIWQGTASDFVVNDTTIFLAGEWRQRSKCELPNAGNPFFAAKLKAWGHMHGLYHCSISSGPWTAAVHHYFSALLASSTHRAYGVGQNYFIAFCLLQGIIGPSSPLLPASEITLIYFAAHLAKTICYTTIKLYPFAVQDLHKQHNFPLKS